MANDNQVIDSPTVSVLSPEQLLEHWQGHRRVTRRVIEVFPEDKLFTYSIGGMRPAVELIQEILGMSLAGIEGIATREWKTGKTASEVYGRPAAGSKKELLQHWDEATEEINRLWSEIPPHRYMEDDIAFGMYAGQCYTFIFYYIDNEIHHRGQLYVYLRSLGVEPPAFPDRS